MTRAPSPLRLRLDGDALISNWNWLARASGSAACGAAIKADGYGLGATAVRDRLARAGCRDFFVASWAEAEALGAMPEGSRLSVLHGVGAEDMPVALASPHRPVLNSAAQVRRWREAGNRPCDVMIDTGMNRLGLEMADVESGVLNGLSIDTLMSHLACADEEHPLNPVQQQRFQAIAARVSAARYSLANSAGICLGAEYLFDLTRPGLALYGGIPRSEASEGIRQVAWPETRVLQRRRVSAGDTIGYNATYTAEQDGELAILNVGYADGYLRGFSNVGSTSFAGRHHPVRGRVSMDLLIVDVTGDPDIGEGDWMTLDYSLPDAAALSGLSQYELLTGLGARFERIWS